MLLSEIFEPRAPIDAGYIAEQIEAELMLELFGGLGGVARGGFDRMKRAAQTVKNDYNDGEIRNLLQQLGKYKDQLKTVIQRNPHAFVQQRSPEVMRARPAVDPARERYTQERRAERGDNRPQPATSNLSALSAAEQRAGAAPRPARRRIGNPGMIPNATAPATRRETPADEMPPMQARQKKPHIKLRAPRAHMESIEMHDEIIVELFGGLGGVLRGGVDRMKQAGQAVKGDFAKGEARAIIQKMAGIIASLKERGYQLPAALAQELKQLQQSAA